MASYLLHTYIAKPAVTDNFCMRKFNTQLKYVLYLEKEGNYLPTILHYSINIQWLQKASLLS